MGKIAHQYSTEDIIEIYRKHINNYNSIIKELRNMMGTAYIKRQNIGIFLKEHLLFCEDAVKILNDAIEAIYNNAVDENICIRLEGLFDRCANEYKKLEDTYKRVSERFTEEFYEFENLHIKLREACDIMEYCDETVIFFRTIMQNRTNINIFYGDTRNIQIQQGTHNSVQEVSKVTNKIKDTEIIKEKTSISKIMKDKICEAVVGFVLFTVASIFYNILKKGGIEKVQNNVKIFLLVIVGISFMLGVGLLIICVFDIINVLSLLKKGAFVELESKIEWIHKISSIFQRSDELLKKDVRTTGRCYKNIDGEIYRIKGKECPHCETQPIGKMFLNYSNYEKKYFWECSQNQSHVVEFDYKKKI